MSWFLCIITYGKSMMVQRLISHSQALSLNAKQLLMPKMLFTHRSIRPVKHHVPGVLQMSVSVRAGVCMCTCSCVCSCLRVFLSVCVSVCECSCVHGCDVCMCVCVPPQYSAAIRLTPATIKSAQKNTPFLTH